MRKASKLILFPRIFSCCDWNSTMSEEGTALAAWMPTCSRSPRCSSAEWQQRCFSFEQQDQRSPPPEPGTTAPLWSHTVQHRALFCLCLESCLSRITMMCFTEMEAKIEHLLKVFSQESLLLNPGSYFSIPADIQLNKNIWLLTSCPFPAQGLKEG